MFRIYSQLQKAIVPGLRYSQYHYLQVLRREIVPGCKWLDIGCGHQLFADWMTSEERELVSQVEEIVGIDRDASGIAKHQSLDLRVIGNLETLPFSGNRFDMVTANMVIEHIERPGIVLTEELRVLKNGGKFIFHTPNRNSFQNMVLRKMPQRAKTMLARVLEGRGEEDVFPAFYRFNTVADVEKFSTESSFEIKEVRLFNSSAVTAALGPLSVVELLLLRILEKPALENRRTNLIVVLSKTLGLTKSQPTKGA